MRLYKFVPTEEIARIVSFGVFRFYELLKYIKIEDGNGRSDVSEGSMSFRESEIDQFIDKLPVGSFNGVKFLCAKSSLSHEYLQQYFVFCMSAEINQLAIGDCKFCVELSADIFDLFEVLLPTPKVTEFYDDGCKFFSHGPVEYYDIHNHPTPFGNHRWREIYKKHSIFSYQNEYRAALFASGHFFDRIRKEPFIIERQVRDENKKKMNFNLKLFIRSGIDEAGWRYLEFDISEFQANLLGKPFSVLEIEN